VASDRPAPAAGETRTGFRVSYARQSNRVAQGLSVLSMALIGVYVLLICLNVALRYLFNAPLGWVSDMGVIFVPLAMAPCLAVATARGMLIVVSMFGERLPRPLRRVLNVLARLATTVVLALIAWKVFGYAQGTLAENRSTLLMGIPVWPAWFAVAGAFALAVPLSLAPPLPGTPQPSRPQPSPPQPSRTTE